MKSFPLIGEHVRDLRKIVLFSEREFYSYEDILKDAEYLANMLGNRKLVAVIAENDVCLISSLFSILESDNILMLLDSKMPEKKFKNIFDRYLPDFVVARNDQISDRRYSPFTKLEELTIFSGNLRSNQEIGNKECAMLIPTSGSTGNPRFVRISYENLRAQARSICQYLEISAGTRTITTLPPHYSFGFSILNSYLWASAEIFVSEATPFFKGYWDLLRKMRISSISGVPYSFEIWKRTGFLNEDLPALRTLTQAGGRFSGVARDDFIESCEKRNRKLFLMYGQTEATARISFLPPDYLVQKRDSIGIPIPGGKLEIMDEEHKPVSEPNTPGQIVYMGPNVSLGYADKRSDLELPDCFNGTLKTGDIGYRDSDGFFYISGRTKRIAKIFGYRINLDDIEEFLTSLEIEAACISNDEHLVIALTDTANIEEIKNSLAIEFSFPANIFKFCSISNIPRLSNGKVDYSSLLLNLERSKDD